MREQLSAALTEYMTRHNLSQVTAANKLGVSQSVISRIKNESWVRESHHIRTVASALGVRKTVKPQNSCLLMSALQEAWDGEKETEKLLADAIKTLGRLAQQRANK